MKLNFYYMRCIISYRWFKLDSSTSVNKGIIKTANSIFRVPSFVNVRKEISSRLFHKIIDKHSSVPALSFNTVMQPRVFRLVENARDYTQAVTAD